MPLNCKGAVSNKTLRTKSFEFFHHVMARSRILFFCPPLQQPGSELTVASLQFAMLQTKLHPYVV